MAFKGESGCLCLASTLKTQEMKGLSILKGFSIMDESFEDYLILFQPQLLPLFLPTIIHIEPKNFFPPLPGLFLMVEGGEISQNIIVSLKHPAYQTDLYLYALTNHTLAQPLWQRSFDWKLYE